MTNVVDIHGDGGRRNAGPAEREKLACLFEAIGNATNATLKEMPDSSDETIRRQMTVCFASVGGFVLYADILRQGTKASYPDGIGAISSDARSTAGSPSSRSGSAVLGSASTHRNRNRT